ncbi:MAG: exodeoxyribonuclease III [Phycisphaerales bacterium JB065]
MRVTTWNVNGMRAALRKGFPEVLERLNPDVLLLQEIRATPDQLPPEWREPDGWHVHWHPAQRPGYSGTAIWSREPIRILNTGHGIEGTELGEGDPEGRLVHAQTGPIRVASVYLPSGSSGEHRQVQKDLWLHVFRDWAAGVFNARTPTLLGGDFNIAHTENDIFHAKSNQNTSGFLPHEREWIGELFDSGWHDFVRAQAGERPGPYTWWSNRGRARELDRGWRIDYLLGNKAASKIAGSFHIDREAGTTVSDHAPVSIDLDL